MTNLTEQWKKGELPSGYYYVKNEFDNIFPSDYSEEYDSINDVVVKDFWTEVSDIVEVLAPVPSYEEWQKLKEFADYSIHNRDELTRQINFWMKENTKLKELLKECRECVDENLEFSKSIGRNRIQPRNKGLLKRIDEVLK